MTPLVRSLRNVRAALSVAENRGYSTVMVPTADLSAVLAVAAPAVIACSRCGQSRASDLHYVGTVDSHPFEEPA